MSTLANALTTTAKVKTYLGITDSASDAVIELLINQATMFIENYCGGRKFLSQDYTEVYDTDGKTIFLNQYPITAIASVKYRSGTPSTPVWNTYNVDSYLTYLNEGYIKFYGNLSKIPQGMQITYTAGYLIDFANETVVSPLTHTLPFDLTMACTMLTAHYFGNRQASGISQMRTEGQEVRFKDNNDTIPDMVKQVLGQYQAFRYGI
jgi:uncharacterized phiE125 gp8 family phage protein